MVRTLAAQYRKAYSGLSRETWLLSLIMLINRSGTMVVPFMTLYLTSPEKGYTIGQAGVIFGLFGAGAFFGAWLGGRLTDRIGFFPVQLITLSGGGILFMVLGQMGSYPLIALFCFLLSFVNESFRPANSTAIAHYSVAENRTRSFALNRLAINLGWAVGGAMGGFLASIDYELLFWVDGATNLFAALLLLLLLRRTPGKTERLRDEGDQRAPKVLEDRKYLGFILVTFLFASCFFQLFTNVPVFYKRALQLTESEIGLLMALNGLLIALFEMVLVYRMEGRRNAKGLIVTGIGLVGLSFLMLNLPLAGFWVGLLAILTV
ncbi:MAG: hypothetical protein RJA57_1060, partial [Bacteroidota bacterium]